MYVEAAVGSALIKQRLDSLDSSALDSSSGEQERRARVAILEMTGLRGIPGGFLAVIPILDKSGYPQLLGIHQLSGVPFLNQPWGDLTTSSCIRSSTRGRDRTQPVSPAPLLHQL